MTYARLLWAGLWRKRARTVFTLLSVAIAFLLFGLLQGVNTWFQDLSAGTHADRLVVVSNVSQLEPLPIAHLRKIESLAGVRRVAAVGAFSGEYQERGKNVLVLATDPAAFFAVYPEWTVDPGQLRALASMRTGAIVGAAVMKAYGWKVGDRVPVRTSVVRQDGSSEWDFQIVGTYDVPRNPMQANRIILNYAYLDEARQFDKGRVFAFLVGIDDPAQSAEISAAIDAQFRNSSDETLTQDETAYAQDQVRQIGNVSAMVNAIVGAVLFTLLFLTGNTMMQSVRERIPELAVLKAIGFSDGSVTALILAEAALLCIGAAALGLAIAAAVFPVTQSLGIGGGALAARVLVAGFGIAAALALACGLPPARRVQKLTIVDALAGR